MASKHASISAEAALRLVGLILGEARQSNSEDVKKTLLHAGIRIADIALASTAAQKKRRKAA